MSLYPNKKNFGIIKSYFRFTFFLLVTSCIIYIFALLQTGTNNKKKRRIRNGDENVAKFNVAAD
jgi:hypothetical protein